MAMIIQFKQHWAAVRMCASQVVNCRLWVQPSPIKICKPSIQPLLNEVTHLPFIDPSESRPTEAKIHHTTRFQTILKHLNSSRIKRVPSQLVTTR